MRRQSMNGMGWMALIALLGGLLTPAMATGADAEALERYEKEWMTAVQSVRQAEISAEVDAAGGVDGAKTGAFGFHTDNTAEPPWWQVDLGESQALARVEVFNRTGDLADRAGKLIVLVSDDGQCWREAYCHDGKRFQGPKEPLVVALDGAPARYVRLALPERGWLHLDEIEVFASKQPEQNIALGKPAIQSSISAWSSRPKIQIADFKFTPEDAELGGKILSPVIEETGVAGEPFRQELAALASADASADYAGRWADLYARSAALRQRFRAARSNLELVDFPALQRAIDDLTRTFPDRYTKGEEFKQRAEAWAKRLEPLTKALDAGEPAALESALNDVDALMAFRAEVLLANPLLDFEKLLFVRRATGQDGLPANWEGNCSTARTGYDNEIAELAPVSPEGRIETLYRPDNTEFVGDLDLNFDADKMLFSMPGTLERWQIWEIGTDGKGLRQVTPGQYDDVDNYDACYLPDGRIVFGSTRFFHGVPCVRGSSAVANLYIMDSDGMGVRQLCFDQDHDWSPAVLNNGRVLYTRWEYADTPHSNTRLLFHMNPDGTAQMEYANSNSFWPNGVFYARAIPGHPTKIVGIVTGHHGVRRMGELLVFDPAQGRREASCAVQRIPGWGQEVKPIISDQLVDASWPKFLHPYPLSEKYFLAACQPTPSSLWGLYLVDVFDNMLLLKEEPGYLYFEPVPLRETARPPVIPDRIDPERKDATVYLADIYSDGGLNGVPRGTVKELRIFTYTYSYRGMGGLLGVVGMDGPWDIRRILGTVPVQEDGSALFRVPANTPISVQPLDSEGKALQLMRSWMTAMPGETLSCVGCHEQQNTTPPVRPTLASRSAPAEIEPWRGPMRGFSFAREVQPVLDKYCIGCHNGEERSDGKTLPDLRGDAMLTDWVSITPGQGGEDGGKFSVSYAQLHRYVRRSGIESDYHMLTPMEFHADTTELVQMLNKGHHGVELDAEAWDRLITWIDLNAPYHGYWSEIVGEERVAHFAERRREMVKRYAGMDDDPENKPPLPPTELSGQTDIRPVVPKMVNAEVRSAPVEGWPLATADAIALQGSAGKARQRTIDLGDGVSLELTLVPAGAFAMGSTEGLPDEQPQTSVRIEKPFWMGCFEVTNAQYARFDPKHDSRIEPKHAYQFGVDGFHVDGPEQPVVRVSWQRAVAFCEWLSERTGEPFALPTEAEWEYACRAGSAEDFSFGALDADFSPYANLADVKLSEFADNPYKVGEPLVNPPKYDDWIPRDNRFSDGGLVTENVGTYLPNNWGLFDMHGNAWEWTRSLCRPYPYDTEDGRNALDAEGRRVVRGGSWYDRPERARAAFRLAYRPYQQVFNVGFRVVCPAKDERIVAKTERAN